MTHTASIETQRDPSVNITTFRRDVRASNPSPRVEQTEIEAVAGLIWLFGNSAGQRAFSIPRANISNRLLRVSQVAGSAASRLIDSVVGAPC
jgi:hypothetical protein